MNEAASELGKMGRGVPKSFTPEERAKRAERMRAINAQRKVVRAEPRRVVRVEGRRVPVEPPPQPKERTVLIALRGR